MEGMDSNSAEQGYKPHPVVAYSGDAGLKGPKTDVQSAGQVLEQENRPPATPFLDFAQTKQLPADFSQTSIAGNGNTVNYNNTYVINKNDNSSKKRQKKRKKDKKEKSHRYKPVQESERGRKRPSSEGPSEELEAKKKKKNPSSAPDKPRVTPLAPSNKGNQNGGVSNATPVPRSKLSTVLWHRKLDKAKSLHLYIREVEYKCEKRGKDLLPGKFLVMDRSAWCYLTVFGTAKNSILKKTKSILVRRVSAVKENNIECDGGDVEPLDLPVSVPEKIIQKMRKEEMFVPLTSVSKGTYEKIRVLINKVGEKKELRGKNGKPYHQRCLEVTDIKPSGKLGKKHDLFLYNKAAGSKLCKPGERVIVSNVGKAENGQYRTYRECSVRKCEI